MSKYASFLDIDDDDHEHTCAKYERISDDAKAGEWQMARFDGTKYKRVEGDPPCTCDNPAPVIYQGSHVQPREGDKRGGFLDLAYMPDYCAQPEGDVPFLRLFVGEAASTYQGMNPGQATIVLDQEQVVRLRDKLTRWLDEREEWS